MTSKTLGQIAYETRQQYYRDAHFDNWAPTEWQFLAAHMKRAEETSAAAIVEECAKVAEQDDSFMELRDWEQKSIADEKGQNIASAIRSLATPSISQIEEPQRGDTDGATSRTPA